ncbi:MAG: hypothetical protein L0Y71_05215 [Gemmataceae bacterium]|nr:hypothetical protein [Gemmataceae bacterium]
MSRLMSFFALGAVALGFSLATPATSQAQTRFGLHVGVGPVHVDVNRGYYSYSPSYSRYDPRFHPGRHHHHGRHHHRDVIVVPSYYHWTPGLGYHTHGTIVVPPRVPVYVRPY